MKLFSENLVDRIEIKTSLGKEYVIGLDDISKLKNYKV